MCDLLVVFIVTLGLLAVCVSVLVVLVTLLRRRPLLVTTTLREHVDSLDDVPELGSDPSKVLLSSLGRVQSVQRALPWGVSVSL